VAGEQHQERHADADQRPRRRLQQIRGRQARRAGGLRPAAEGPREAPEFKILDGQFTAVQQAVGCNKPAAEGARYLAEFVEKAKKSGLVASLIEKHKVKGLSVAPPA
jgi:hypothetical protein